MMNRNTEPLDVDATLSLDDAPVPLRLPAGSAIFALRGNVWITQERLRDDVVLARGERFNVNGSELILASALKGSAAIRIVPRAEARRSGQPDLHDFLRTRAAQLRDETMGRLSSRLGSSIAGWFDRPRGLASARSRALSH